MYHVRGMCVCMMLENKEQCDLIAMNDLVKSFAHYRRYLPAIGSIQSFTSRIRATQGRRVFTAIQVRAVHSFDCRRAAIAHQTFTKGKGRARSILGHNNSGVDCCRQQGNQECRCRFRRHHHHHWFFFIQVYNNFPEKIVSG